MRRDLQAEGDRDLSRQLLAEIEIKEAIERQQRDFGEAGARLQLLGSALRLTPEMAPDIQAILDACRGTLEIETPLECYVYPGAMFNAAAVRPEGGRLLVLLSSSLLEAFEPGELRFVAGHELGHHLFEHHRIPVVALLRGGARLPPGLVLQLFAWQRYAEISADRAGVVCAGGILPAAQALFKLASGLRGGLVRVSIDQFMAQAGELREEAGKISRESKSPRSDWFATHPFSPLRLQAAQLFAGSELMIAGGMPRGELEAHVQDLMTTMRPSYLQERSGTAEVMRRLLFAGGVAIAAASGKINDEEIAALEKLLGPGSVPFEVKPDVIRKDLAARIEDVKSNVPPLRRAQVIRDLCVIARADGRMERAELDLIREIAAAVEVDPSVVDATACGAEGCEQNSGS